jgi:hypothetical protein
MLPRTLALVVLILGSLTAVLGGGYLASQGQVGLRMSNAASVTPTPPAEKLPAQAPAATANPAASAAGAPGAGAAGAGGGGAPGAAAAPGGGGGGGGAAPPPPPPMVAPPPPAPMVLPPPPAVYPSAGAPAGAPGYAAAAPGATAPAAAPPPGTRMELKEVTLEAATVIEVQLAEQISTETAKPEDRFVARVLKPVVGGGVEAIPKDAPVFGVVALVDKAGAIRGRPRIEWQFESVEAHGQKYNIVAPRLFYEGESPTGAATAKVGTSAAGGALVGILLGGKKGAISGAAAGAAGGVTTVMASPRKAAVLPAGGTFAFRLNAPLKLNVPVPVQPQ